MNIENYGFLAYALSAGSLESIDNDHLHSVLLHQASAARILKDHAGVEYDFESLEALTNLGLPDDTVGTVTDAELDDAIEEIGRDVDRVSDLSDVAMVVSDTICVAGVHMDIT